MTGYAHRVAAAFASGTLDRRGAWQITVAHDPACPHRTGGGECQCTPEITATDLATGRILSIGPDGLPSLQQRLA